MNSNQAGSGAVCFAGWKFATTKKEHLQLHKWKLISNGMTKKTARENVQGEEGGRRRRGGADNIEQQMGLAKQVNWRAKNRHQWKLRRSEILKG